MPQVPIAGAPTTGAFLRLEGISKAFVEGGQPRPVLRDLNASFRSGEFVALLGRSGTGKSTLLNIISGIERADSGAVWLNGQNLMRMDDLQRTLFRRRHIGFVFQFFNLIHTLSVLENVALPLELNGVPARQANAQAEALLATVGLAERRLAFPDRLSGGEQQRVAIARALIHDPLLVLADEPTGNLDEQTGKQVLAVLDRLTRQAGKNLILVTHGADAAGYADRVLHLREGQLVEGER